MADGSDTAQPAPRRGHRFAPAEVWARVRDDYLSGLSASACCRRHDVGLRALRQRAADEGWRRRDQAWTPPADRLDPSDQGRLLEDSVGGDLDLIDLRDLAWVAHRRMVRAVLRGDARDALRWRRVRRALVEDQAALEDREADLDDLHHPDSVFSDGRVQTPPTAAPRADPAAGAAPAPDDPHHLHGLDSFFAVRTPLPARASRPRPPACRRVGVLRRGRPPPARAGPRGRPALTHASQRA